MQLITEKRNVVKSQNFKTADFGIVLDPVAYEILSSDIYTYKVRAVIRETSCNAEDARKKRFDETGFDRAIEVHLPTQLNNIYSVRDFGYGLSDEDVRGSLQCRVCDYEHNLDSGVEECHCGGRLEKVGGVYNTYFKSTKRDDNTVTGCLGLGTKSPFTISDSFRVESYHEGVKRTYYCYMDDDNKPHVSLLTETDSDEPSGIKVEVNVPEDKIHSFKEEAVFVYSTFEKLPKINLQSVIDEINDELEDYKIMGDGYEFTGTRGTCYAVMGNVSYEIPRSYIQLEGRIYFPLGSLKFNPGREQLSLNDETIKSLEQRISVVESDLGYGIFKTIRQEPTKFERALKLNELRGGLLSSLGNEIVRRLEYFAYKSDFDNNIHVYSSGGYRSTEHKLPVSDRYKYCIVDEDKSVRGYKMRIDAWCSDNYTNLITLTEEEVKRFDIPEKFISSLDDLPLIQNTVKYEACKEKMFVYNGKGRYGRDQKDCWDAVDIDLNDGVERVYVNISRYWPEGFGDCYAFKRHLDRYTPYIGDVKVYGIKNALVKQKRFQESNFIPLSDYINREMEKVIPTFLIENFTGDNEIITIINRVINSGLIKDPMFDLFKKCKEKIGSQLPTNLINCHRLKEIPKVPIYKNTYNNIVEKYPILKLLSSSKVSKKTVKTVVSYMKG